jgi:sulfoquinovosidase
MQKWKLLLFVLGQLIFTAHLVGQFHLDTTGNYIQIRQEKGGNVIAELNLAEITNDYIRVKVKDKLGSFHIRHKQRQPHSSKIEILYFDHQSILFSSNGKKMNISQQTHTSNSSAFHFCLMKDDSTINHWQINWVTQLNEFFYGGGMQFSSAHRNSRTTVHLAEENGIGRGSGSLNKWTRLAGVNGKEYSTYCPVAYVLGNRAAYEIAGASYSEMYVNKTRLTMDVFASEVIVYLYDSNPVNNTKGVPTPLHNFSERLWHQAPLPDWAMGTILGVQGGTFKVSEKLNFLLQNGAHIDAVWIQDWVGKQPTKFGSRLQWKWQLDTVSYPMFDAFRAELTEKNIKLLGYINPFFAQDGPYTTEGLQKGYFIKNELDETERFNFGGMQGYMLDLFNPAAYVWMKGILKTNLIDNGFDGWMADFAEWYPIEKGERFALSANRHNQYPVLWAKLNREVIRESGKELIFFNRSGSSEVWKYSNMMWLGDQLTDYSEYDGLPSVLKAYVSSAISGLPIVHSDVGGYTSVKKPLLKNVLRDESLLKDWMLLEAFTPVFRTHEGLLPDENVQVYDNEKLAKIFARFTRIHKLLLPYFNKHLYRYTSTVPVWEEHSYVGKYAINWGPDILIGLDAVDGPFDSSPWRWVTNEGYLADEVLPNQRIAVLIRKGSELEKMISALP